VCFHQHWCLGSFLHMHHLTQIEGRGNGIKTNVVNNVDIAKALERPPECELHEQQLPRGPGLMALRSHPQHAASAGAQKRPAGIAAPAAAFKQCTTTHRLHSLAEQRVGRHLQAHLFCKSAAGLYLCVA
jgi:hypothetical protein